MWSVFARYSNGKSKKVKKKKSRSTVRRFLHLFWFVSNMRRFQVCSNLLFFFFYALDTVNIFLSAHVPGHLKDGQPASYYQIDFEIDL